MSCSHSCDCVCLLVLLQNLSRIMSEWRFVAQHDRYWFEDEVLQSGFAFVETGEHHTIRFETDEIWRVEPQFHSWRQSRILIPGSFRIVEVSRSTFCHSPRSGYSTKLSDVLRLIEMFDHPSFTDTVESWGKTLNWCPQLSHGCYASSEVARRIDFTLETHIRSRLRHQFAQNSRRGRWTHLHAMKWISNSSRWCPTFSRTFPTTTSFKQSLPCYLSSQSARIVVASNTESSHLTHDQM